jgi:hypothetical protein
MRRRRTLKALANFSPGLLQPWVIDIKNKSFATLKGLRRLFRFQTATQPFQGCVFHLIGSVIPRVAKAQPWAKVSERFQRNPIYSLVARNPENLAREFHKVDWRGGVGRVSH